MAAAFPEPPRQATDCSPACKDFSSLLLSLFENRHRPFIIMILRRRRKKVKMKMIMGSSQKN